MIVPSMYTQLTLDFWTLYSYQEMRNFRGIVCINCSFLTAGVLDIGFGNSSSLIEVVLIRLIEVLIEVMLILTNGELKIFEWTAITWHISFSSAQFVAYWVLSIHLCKTLSLSWWWSLNWYKTFFDII